jgi:hypothetical protein
MRDGDAAMHRRLVLLQQAWVRRCYTLKRDCVQFEHSLLVYTPQSVIYSSLPRVGRVRRSRERVRGLSNT